MTRTSPIPRLLLAVFAAALLVPATARAATVTVAWDPNPPEENVTGYVVCYATTSRFDEAFTGYSEVDAGDVTEFSLTLPDDGATYYIAVVAYNASGLRSDYSDEVSAGPAEPQEYQVTASAGPNGAIDPSGTTTVSAGDSLSFTITPDPGYEIQDVRVDGASVGAVASYTLSAVSEDHTVTASFAAEDADDNGLPDAWELAYFGTTAVDPDADPDGDLVTNLDEYRNGSDPTVADLDPSLTPAVWEPVSGGTVATRYPVLSVYNPVHGPERTVSYEFQVATDPGMTGLVLSRDGVAEGELATAWALTDALDDGTRYYWRARAYDGAVPSPWTPVCTFYVDTTAPETSSIVDVFEVVSADETAEVEGAGGTVGVRVELPAGALPYDFTLVVGSVDNPPAPAAGTRLLGKVYEFGPHGASFSQEATVLLPYSEDQLAEGGVTDPSELGVFTYNTDTLAWEPVPVAAVDYGAQRLVCRVTHFSLYAVGAVADDGSGDTPAASKAGGGGGCFIQSLW